MVTETIIYSPLLDFLLLQRFLEKGKELDPYAQFHFKPENDCHTKINTLDFAHFPKQVGYFTQDSTIASSSKDDIQALNAFIKKHSIGLSVPAPEESGQSRVKNFTAVAFMQLIMQWPEEYSAHDKEYTCNEIETGQKKTVAGFQLQNVRIGVNREDFEVTAVVRLDGDFSVFLADTSAFAQNVLEFEKILENPFAIYEQIVKFKPFRWEGGSVYVPNVNDEFRIKNHLVGIEYETSHENMPDDFNDWIEKIILTDSEQLAKLELSKWGIKARAEAYARGSMVLGCSVSHERHYHLSITHGLVMGILYQNQPLFVAYIPQKRFTFVV